MPHRQDRHSGEQRLSSVPKVPKKPSFFPDDYFESVSAWAASLRLKAFVTKRDRFGM
jgi:hypothetical protein